MLAIEPVFIFTRKLNELGAPYMISGGVAAMMWGDHRDTRDVDIVIDLDREHILKLPAIFPLEEFYCPPVEAMLNERARAQRGMFNLLHHASGFKADLYMLGRDPLQQWGMERRVRVEEGNDVVWISPPEYVIVRKLEFYREGGSERHLRDIAGMLLLSSDKINYLDLEPLLQDRGLQSAWLKAQQYKL